MLGPDRPARPGFRELPAPAPLLPERTRPVRQSPGLERETPSPYQNRFGPRKELALVRHGGGADTEAAVARGLAYLVSIQAGDGAFGTRADRDAKYGDVRIGKTGLALLAFLGAGHLPGGSGEHSPAAARALRFLLDEQKPNGHFGEGSSYGHGIACYALAEAHALGVELGRDGALERGLARILDEQVRHRDPQRDGGWGYFFHDDHVWSNDRWPRVSVTSWQVMALVSARLGGLEVPEAALGRARDYLLASWDDGRGAFRYSQDPARLRSGYPILPASTPAALFALSLLGVDTGASALDRAHDFVQARAPREFRYRGDDAFVLEARGNLYFWYYGTLASFRVGGDRWSRWNTALKETLLPAQERDGSWRSISTYGRYAGDEDDERAYSTALCVLSLEVYYRYFTPLLEAR